LTRDDLKKVLPHREPMLLLDEAEVDETGTATGAYLVKGYEFFLDGHFPGNPVVPGVILCEIMAQTCGVLMSGEVEGKTPYYTGLDKVKFRGVVKPGDRIEFKCEIIKKKMPFVFAKGRGFVDGKLCIQGEFSFALI